MISRRIAGVDIGNSTTEVCIAKVTNTSQIEFETSAFVTTTGTKGTLANIKGIKEALQKALGEINQSIGVLDRILLNEAAPVIGDMAMETITQTIITDDGSPPAGSTAHRPAR